jgi:hypothetical protein
MTSSDMMCPLRYTGVILLSLRSSLFQLVLELRCTNVKNANAFTHHITIGGLASTIHK